MIIHKGIWVWDTWIKHAFVGYRVAATTNGYITKCKFQEYRERFVRYLKNHKLLDRPHLLIIDSHKSQIYNLPFYKLMIDNNIHVLALYWHISFFNWYAMKIFRSTSDKSLGLFAIRGDLRNSFSNTFGLGGDFSCGIPSGIWKNIWITCTDFGSTSVGFNGYSL